MSTSIFPEDPFLSVRTIAEFESLDATLNPFRVSLEELEEKIDLAERYGLCSGEVAEAARDEIETLILEMHFLVMSKVELHDRLRAAERASR